MNDSSIKTNEAIRYGWTTVKKDLWYFVAVAFVSQVISGIFSDSSKKPEDSKDSYGLDIIGIPLSVWMTCGYMVMMLSYHGGKKLPFSALFKQGKYFWRVLGASLLTFLIVLVGLILLIVPGIYFALRFQFVIPLIVDKNLSISAAMNESTRLTQGRKMSLLGFDLALFGVILLGVLALVVGVFVAIPVTWLAMVYVYRQLQDTKTSSGSAQVTS